MLQTLMIAVSTRQNTTNAIPAIQLNPDNIVFIETTGAKKSNWSKGISDVLEQRKINVLPPIELTEKEDARIDLIYNKILKFLQNKNYQVIWNIGGGQKAQQIALWRAFEYRINKHYDDFVCYANVYSKQIEIWKFNRSKDLIQETLVMDSNLSAKEIFQIFGFEAKYDQKNLIYSNGEIRWVNKHTYKLLEYKEFRKFFFLTPTTSYSDEKNQKTFQRKDFEKQLKEYNDDKKLKDKVEKIITKHLSENKKCLTKKELLQIIPQIRKETIRHIAQIFNKEQEKISLDVSP